MINPDDVVIRPFQESDTQAFFDLVDQSRVNLAEWLPWVESHVSVIHSRRYISAGIVQQALRNGGQWGVFVQGKLAGEVGLHWIQMANLSTSMGYWLGTSYLGQGIASIACSHLLAICFQDLKLNRVELNIAQENEPSLNLALRLGFVEEGCRRQMVFHRNRFWDHKVFGLLRQDYVSDGYWSNRNPPASAVST